MEIYLDNSATTRVYPEVAEFMTKIMCEDYGNPSSMHHKGVEAEKYVRQAREIFASLMKCDQKNICFTSGGTESDNLAIIGAAESLRRRGTKIITTQIEHPAVLRTFKYLETQGFEAAYIPVDKAGVIDLRELEKALDQDTVLVSVMHTNNEIGSLQPITQISEFIRKKSPNALFHVDAVQGFGKARIIPRKMGIDLLSVSSHKIHGPKGVGMLYIGDDVRLTPISYGGGQQGGLRNGTENVPGIAGMALAARMIYEHLDENVKKMYALKEKLINGALKLGDVSVNGISSENIAENTAESIRESITEGVTESFKESITEGVTESNIVNTAPHIVSLSFTGIRAEVLLHALEDAGVYVSAGSACATNKPEPSATLKAIGLDRSLWDCTLRFSMSEMTTEAEIDATLEALGKLLPVLRRFQRK